MEKREDTRNSAEAVIGYHLFTTAHDTCQEKGIMRDYSLNGMIIESDKSYPTGSVLLVRVLKIKEAPSNKTVETGFRTISLAEVRWQEDLKETGRSRYKIGLRYLR